MFETPVSPLLLVMVAVLVAACAPAGLRAPGQLAVQAPTRPDSECRDDVAQALADPQSPGLRGPVPKTELVPPPDPPRDLRGRLLTVRLFVDTQGRIAPDSIAAPTSQDSRFNAAFRRRMEQVGFWPATYHGCAVPFWFEMQMVLRPQSESPRGARIPALAVVTRPDSACQAEVRAARADSALPGVVPAQVDSLMLAPPGTPRNLRGHRIAMLLLVDQHGRVVADSTRLTPAIADTAYDRAVRARLAGDHFTPAVYHGCAVPYWYPMWVTF